MIEYARVYIRLSTNYKLQDTLSNQLNDETLMIFD